METYNIGGINLEVGDTLIIDESEFELEILPDAGGNWAIWICKSNPNIWIYATPNYEGEGVPVQIDDYDEGVFEQEDERYDGKVNGYRQYKSIVKTLSERIFKRIKAKPCSK